MLRSILFAGALAALTLPAQAAVKTYQVTGPVLAADDQSITVQKGAEKWEIARDATTKITGDVAVGSKVTIEYRMAATSIDAKAAKPAAAPAKK